MYMRARAPHGFLISKFAKAGQMWIVYNYLQRQLASPKSHTSTERKKLTDLLMLTLLFHTRKVNNFGARTMEEETDAFPRYGQAVAGETIRCKFPVFLLPHCHLVSCAWTSSRPVILDCFLLPTLFFSFLCQGAHQDIYIGHSLKSPRADAQYSLVIDARVQQLRNTVVFVTCAQSTRPGMSSSFLHFLQVQTRNALPFDFLL